MRVEKTLTIIAMTLAIYAIWIWVGLFALSGHCSAMNKMPKYKATTITSSIYELTFWPKVLYDVSKFKK